MRATVSEVANPTASQLAMAVAANGRIDSRELAELDRQGAFGLLGVRRERFLRMAEAAVEEIGLPLSKTRWLRLSDRSRMLVLQHAIQDPKQRLLVCRLSAAVIHADGQVTMGERQVYESMLHHWELTHAAVTQANHP